MVTRNGNSVRVTPSPCHLVTPSVHSSDFNFEQRLSIFNWLCVLDQYLSDNAAALRHNVVEDLHGLDLADDRVVGNLRARLDVGILVRAWLGVKGARRRAGNDVILLGVARMSRRGRRR